MPFAARFARVAVAAFFFSPLVSRAVAQTSPLPPAVAATGEALAAASAGARVDELPGGFVLLMPPETRPVLAREPRYQWMCARAVFVYAPRDDRAGHPGLARVVSVHYNLPDTDDALRTARLCAQLLRLHRERFGRDAKFPRGSVEARVWLFRQTPLGAQPMYGGESRDNQVYVFATATPRKPIEWVRTLAHEWGHLTLPAARGFSAPENDASGFLGERLYLKWLREEQRSETAASTDDWAERDGLDRYHARQTAPLIARFQQAGPDAAALNKRDADAMDLYVGAVLAMDDALGSRLLAEGLFGINDVAPRDLFDALSRVVRSRPLLPIRLPAWVPMASTTYEIVAATPGGLAIDTRPPLPLRSAAPTSIRVTQAGWKWIRATTGNIEAITLRRGGTEKSARQ